MRLIDADALIDKYGDWYTEEGTEEGYIGTIKGIVDSMPIIDPEPHWIPVTERLPDKKAEVIYSLEPDIDKLIITIKKRQKGEEDDKQGSNRIPQEYD